MFLWNNQNETIFSLKLTKTDDTLELYPADYFLRECALKCSKITIELITF